MKNQCRFCQSPLKLPFIDLGFAPPSNDYLSQNELDKPESYIPLRTLVCEKCWLVQTQDFKSPQDLFKNDYAYFSSASASWVNHSRDFAEFIIDKLKLNKESFIVEIACNDGYLLKNFYQRNLQCLGIEPTLSSAKIAKDLGINVMEKFFNAKLALEIINTYSKADLICANNVLAHVPDILGFVEGIRILLKDNGTATFEFPHLLQLIKLNQFDTIYHEHYSYLSFTFLKNLLTKAKLKAYKIEKLKTHGGSLRVYVCKNEASLKIENSIQKTLEEENNFEINKIKTYKSFQEQAIKIKNNFHEFLIKEYKAGKKIVAYGAAAKGNTLLNYCGIKKDLIQYVCDISSSKQNKFLPGSHIPIVKPEKLIETKPDFVIILPWNLKKEISEQLNYIKNWGGKFVIAVPNLEIF